MTAQPYRLISYSAIVWMLAALVAMAADVPPLRGRVNDYAGVMGQEQARSLETRLAQFEQETGHQVAVLTIPTLDGEDIEGFGIRVAEAWKIGKKGFDNGVILIVAIKDRRLRLEVGYGLEGVLPDALAKQIISDYIVPQFRAQFKDPTMLENLEKAAQRYEAWQERRAPGNVAVMREWMQQERQKKASAAKA